MHRRGTQQQRGILVELRVLIDGFSSAFALEVLSTFDYVRHMTGATTVADIRARLSDWSDWKVKLMRPVYVERTLEQLTKVPRLG